MTDIAISTCRYKLSQTNSFWIFQLQARQAQLKRRLAVIERHGGSAGGWRRSIYPSWRSPALILAESHRAKEMAQTCLDVLCLSSLWEIALFCHLVWSTGYDFAVLLWNHPPTTTTTIWWSQLIVDAHTSVTHMHQRHAHWAISQASLTRVCLLLSDGFSWPINYFIPGRT